MAACRPCEGAGTVPCPHCTKGFVPGPAGPQVCMWCKGALKLTCPRCEGTGTDGDPPPGERPRVDLGLTKKGSS